MFAVAALVALCMAAQPAQADAPGLLLVAHGAPMAAWNQPVIAAGERIASKVLATGQYKAVRTAMLEFAEPSVPAMVAELEAAGCDRIVVVPLFVAPSGHTAYDLPAVLGVYTSEEVKATLEKEHADIAQPKVPITITATMSGGDFLQEYAVGQVRKLSSDPPNEALVILAHGDEGHHAQVESMVKEVTTYCCGQVGIDHGDWAFVEMGQSFAVNAGAAITRALENKERVLVVGLYVSSSAKSVARNGKAMASGAKFMGIDVESIVDDEHVVFSEEGIVGDDAMLDWAVATALSALN